MRPGPRLHVGPREPTLRGERDSRRAEPEAHATAREHGHVISVLLRERSSLGCVNFRFLRGLRRCEKRVNALVQALDILSSPLEASDHARRASSVRRHERPPRCAAAAARPPRPRCARPSRRGCRWRPRSARAPRKSRSDDRRPAHVGEARSATSWISSRIEGADDGSTGVVVASLMAPPQEAPRMRPGPHP